MGLGRQKPLSTPAFRFFTLLVFLPWHCSVSDCDRDMYKSSKIFPVSVVFGQSFITATETQLNQSPYVDDFQPSGKLTVMVMYRIKLFLSQCQGVLYKANPLDLNRSCREYCTCVL